jgi:4-hydroxy-2-oxoheptanedioate aldolase
MRDNKTKAKLKRGEPVFGVIAKSGEPLLAEVIGLCGYDYYMVDGEHGLINPEQIVHVVRACETVGVTPLARIGSLDAKVILAHLDAGVQGIMVPGLESAEEIAELVAACKYPPEGKRGLGLARSADYMIGTDATAYVAHANANVLVLPQFEDVALLDRLPELATVPGVDGFVIGPRDLSLSMGFPDGPNHPEVQAVIDEAIAIFRAAGVWAGTTAGSAEAARQQIDRGAQIILNSLPNLLRRSSDAFLEARP